jgi:hypothetical protein
LVEAVTSTKDMFKEMEGKQIHIVHDAPASLKAAKKEEELK